MNTSNLFEKTVQGIITDGKQGPYQGKLISDITVLDVYAARRVMDGLEALMLLVEQKSVLPIRKWPQSEGFSVEVELEEEKNTDSRVQVCIQLTDIRHVDVFFVLCEDICKLLLSETDESAATKAFHSRLVKWQTFFKKGRQEGLSEEKQVGLFGELIVMMDVLLPRIESSLVLQAWRGCKRASQDYQFADWTLEVKTSRATIVEKVWISNVQQLDEDGKSPMILTVVHVHANPTVGYTLPEIISELRNKLEGEAGELIEVGLFEVGYLDVHEKLYMDIKYRVLNISHFKVEEDFPRLKRTDLPDGVKGVKYEISIDSAKDYRVNEETLYSITKMIPNND